MDELLKLIIEKRIVLTGSQMLVADYVTKNFYQVPFLSITSLAEEIGVSESTIIKFCSQLGYEKFGEFKRIVSEHVHSKLVMSNKIMKLEQPTSKNGIFYDVMEEEIENVHATMINQTNREILPDFLSILFKAKTIYVTGGRSSAILASYFVSMLRYLGLKVYDISSGIGDYLDKISMADPGDLVITISFPRYTSLIIDAMKALKKKEVSVVLITDSVSCPGYQYADMTFYCSITSNTYFPSYASCISLFSAICRAASIKNKHESSKYVQQLEKKLLESDVFV